jgi:hypothetical protein
VSIGERYCAGEHGRRFGAKIKREAATKKPHADAVCTRFVQNALTVSCRMVIVPLTSRLAASGCGLIGRNGAQTMQQLRSGGWRRRPQKTRSGASIFSTRVLCARAMLWLPGGVVKSLEFNCHWPTCAISLAGCGEAFGTCCGHGMGQLLVRSTYRVANIIRTLITRWPLCVCSLAPFQGCMCVRLEVQGSSATMPYAYPNRKVAIQISAAKAP